MGLQPDADPSKVELSELYVDFGLTLCVRSWFWVRGRKVNPTSTHKQESQPKIHSQARKPTQNQRITKKGAYLCSGSILQHIDIISRHNGSHARSYQCTLQRWWTWRNVLTQRGAVSKSGFVNSFLIAEKFEKRNSSRIEKLKSAKSFENSLLLCDNPKKWNVKRAEAWNITERITVFKQYS